MATIRAFKAYRPSEQLVTKVAALPYDVMSTEEAKHMVNDNPYSFLHVDKPEMHIQNPVGDELYAFAGNTLNRMIEEEIFIQDESSIYIYGLTNAYTTQYGIVCCVSAKEYDQGIIKKHENTRTDKELDRIKHVTYCNAHTGPIFLAYKDLDQVTAWMMSYVAVNQPVYQFTSEDGVKHQVFKVSDEDVIANITATFEETDALYIADGHHRAAAAAAVARNQVNTRSPQEEAEYFLATIFPKDHLYIMDYNRVLKDESGLDESMLFDALRKVFEVEYVESEVYTPIERHTFGMRYHNKWYKLMLKPQYVEECDPVACLDVSILQKHVLDPLFKITDPKNDKRIDFVGGIRGIEELNKRTNEDMDVAFSMYPTSMDELINVADAGELMPPKSTWFEPKLRSGIFIHKIE
ncbi:DUF1015 domain-containing protein [Cellulosilyticum sp. I15G10I2]|uniref:DUF1015 domain-containing protein n=1 Tax=Cellulosilyticum sp. I15G10I2 TaxID=1892843 RepID=UPI00085C122C|nr:DUF1015 family protein [Cellulosilyticum sp. I15G10I2]